MVRIPEDELPRRPLSYHVTLVVLGLVVVAVAVGCVSAVHPPVGRFRTLPGGSTTTLHLSAGDRYTVYGDNANGDTCRLREKSGATLRDAGYGVVLGGPTGSARYDLVVTRTGTYHLGCNVGSFGDSPGPLYLGPDRTRTTLTLLPFFPGIPVVAFVLWRMVRLRRRRVEARAWAARF